MHPPADALKRCARLGISFNIAANLLTPEFIVRRREFASSAGMSMPKTTMDEDRIFEAGKNDVRPTGKVGIMEGIAETCSMQSSSDFEFLFGTS